MAATELSWPAEGVALCTMVRAGEMNTLSLELLDEIAAALDEAEAKEARALVLTGSGRAFCCGAHLDYFTTPDPRIGSSRFDIRDNYLMKIARLFDRIEMIGVPVVAAVNGFALGGGCELALACDFRLIAREARIGLPEVKLGATPGAGGVQKLHRFVGRGKALEWILLAEHVTADEAERHGLVTSVHEADELLPAALAVAERLRALSPMAIAQAKDAIHVCGDIDLRSARRYGAESLSMLIGSDDWQEGMSAFMERRKPEF